MEGGWVALDADVKASSKSYFTASPQRRLSTNARDPNMDMYDEPNPDRFDHGGSGGPPFGYVLTHAQ